MFQVFGDLPLCLVRTELVYDFVIAGVESNYHVAEIILHNKL